MSDIEAMPKREFPIQVTVTRFDDKHVVAVLNARNFNMAIAVVVYVFGWIIGAW